jgi:PHD/YefM family antitoxin component YafN of YafNO toxin-antitoxin module
MEQARRDCKPASKRVPIVLMRSNNKPWLVLIEASDWVRVSEILLHARVQAECRVPEAL